MKEDILVTIVVVTYNSSKTVLETLSSIKSQSYNRIELIISDDSSVDDTVEVVEKWSSLNRQRFLRVVILKSRTNRGVAANFNKGFKNASGEWIKIIAGDDILLPGCIGGYMNFVQNNGEAKFVFSRVRGFEVKDGKNLLFEDVQDGLANMFFECNCEKQHKLLLRQNYCSAPTAFINRGVLQKLGYCDESIPMIEDLPLWLKATSGGYRLSYIDKNYVLYRIGESATRAKLCFYKESAIRLNDELQKRLILPNISKLDISFWLYQFKERLLRFIIITICANKKNATTRIVWLVFFSMSFSNWRFVIIPKLIRSLKDAR
jgi:glycosyltransferase involved in cell wall biosynthesis